MRVERKIEVVSLGKKILSFDDFLNDGLKARKQEPEKKRNQKIRTKNQSQS
jgi:hypothetical protein